MSMRLRSICIVLLSVMILAASRPVQGAPVPPVPEEGSLARQRADLVGAAQSPQFAVEVARLMPDDVELMRGFGRAVDLDGGTLVVGASEAAYVFQREGATWTQQAKLTAGDGAKYIYFGGDVAIEGDTIIVGADYDDRTAGSVYVFRRDGATWLQQAKITAQGTPDGMHLGEAVALSGDWLLAGAPLDDERSSFAGAAYVFQKNGTSWTQQAKLMADDGAWDDWFGVDVALSGDTAVVLADDDAGSAYVFRRSGPDWTQVQKLPPSRSEDIATGCVAIDGDTILVGSPTDGKVYLFQESVTGWILEQTVTASDTESDDRFGSSVASDGDFLLVGSEAWSGFAYAFLQTRAGWTEQQKIVAADASVGDGFGSAVCIYGDTLVVGSPRAHYGGPGTGLVYVYQVVAEPAEAEPGQEATLVYTDTQGLATTIQAPAEVFTTPTTLVYRPIPVASESPRQAFANHAFDLAAYPAADGPPGPTLDPPLTVTVQYSEADVATVIDEGGLALMAWDGSEWLDAATTCVPPVTYTREPTGNLLSIPICQLGTYGLYGPTQHVYLPHVVTEPPLIVAYAGLDFGRVTPWYIEGAVENLSSRTVCSVTVKAELYDEVDNRLGTYRAKTALVATFPGMLNPFETWTNLSPATWIERLEVAIDSYSPICDPEYRPVTILSGELVHGAETTHLYGEIRNDESVTLSDIQVLVEWQIYGFGYATLATDELSPGETTAYTGTILFVEPWIGPPEWADVQGQGAVSP